MNAERLLQLSDRVSEAPDSIPRLRRFILDLAVRGKLVEQDPSEAPEPGLVERLADVSADHGSLPPNWCIATLGAVLDFQYGKGLKKSDRTESGPVPVYGSNGIVGYTHEALTDKTSVIVGRKGSAGALNLCIGPSWTTDVAYYVEVPIYLNAQYLFSALSTLGLDGLGKGVKPGLSRSDAYQLSLPVPPLAEQHRIVAKVDELMALCDSLEAERGKRERTRDRLTTASLSRLTAPDVDAVQFKAHADFAIRVLPELTTRPDQIKVLRQTILDLAVRGKLVEQDPSDEPASDVLSCKFSLPEGYSRRRKMFKEGHGVSSHATSGEIPKSWRYVDIQTLYERNIIIDFADGNHGALYPRSSEFGSSGVLFVSARDLRNGKVNWESCARLNERRAEQLKKGWAQSGDVLLTHNATVGRVAQVKEDVEPFLLGTSVTFYRLNPSVLSPDFFFYLLRSSIWQNQLAAIMEQTTRNQVSIQKQAFFFVPFPPLPEQHRIVAKTDELMSLCEKLERGLNSGQRTRSSLLEALLVEALDTVSMEAAESH